MEVFFFLAVCCVYSAALWPLSSSESTLDQPTFFRLPIGLKTEARQTLPCSVRCHYAVQFFLASHRVVSNQSLEKNRFILGLGLFLPFVSLN